MSSLSPLALELIQKARIVRFSTWQDTYCQEVIEIFQTADDQGRYLTPDDWEQLQRLNPLIATLWPAYQQLLASVSAIVDEARASILQTFPTIAEPGGELYPAARAEACWRDFWHFLRCISYGIAGQRTDFTSPDGLHHMQLLYQELQVPLAAMLAGLEAIKVASLSRLESYQPEKLSPYFDHLIAELQQFVVLPT